MEPNINAIKFDVNCFETDVNQLITNVEEDQTTKSVKQLADFLVQNNRLSLSQEHLDRLKNVRERHTFLKENLDLTEIISNKAQSFLKADKARKEIFSNPNLLESIYEFFRDPYDLSNLALANKEIGGEGAFAFISTKINKNPKISMIELGFKNLQEILSYLRCQGVKLTTLNLGDLSINQKNLEEIIRFCPNLQILTIKNFTPIIDYDPSQYYGGDIDNETFPPSPVFKELGELMNRLSDLRELRMPNCDCDDIFLNEIKELKKVEKLKFSTNSVEWGIGRVTDVGLGVFSKFENLKYLNTGYRFCISIQALLQSLSKFNKLEKLLFNHNIFLQNFSLPAIPNLVSLQFLALTFTTEVKIEFILALKNLKTLYIEEIEESFENVEDICRLNELKKLKEIGFWESLGNDEVDQLVQLSNIECLFLYQTNTHLLERLKEMPRVTQLKVQSWLMDKDIDQNISLFDRSVMVMQRGLTIIECLDKLTKVQLPYYPPGSNSGLEIRGRILSTYTEAINELKERRPDLEIVIYSKPEVEDEEDDILEIN